MVSIKELLGIPRFSKLQVLNQNADLGRAIGTIEISETPDMAGYLPKDTLLLTTAMAFKENPHKLCELIASLDKLPAAGMGIKLGRFIPELDPEILEFADSLGFPILQIPMSVTLGTISQQLLSYVWDDQTEKLHYALDIQQQFSNLMIRGATLESLVRHLGSILKRSVILINPFGEVVATSRHLQAEKKLLTHLVCFIRSKRQQNQSYNQEVTFMMDLEKQPSLLVSVFPVKVMNYFPYLLIILNADQIPYPFSQLSIEQANIVLSYTIYKNMTVAENVKNEQKEFFKTLVNQQFDNRDDIKNWNDYGKNFGIIDTNTYQVVLIWIENSEKHTTIYAEELEMLVYEWIRSYTQQHLGTTLLFPGKQHHYILLFQKREPQLEKYFMQIREYLEDTLNISIGFSIGNAVNEIQMIRFSYQEALEAMEEGKRNDSGTYMHFYHSKGLQYMFEKTPQEDIQYFCLSTLKALAYPKNTIDIELRNTLQTFLDCQCEITETSQKLFIHRNTVKYRIAKCEQILGTTIQDSELSLNLRLALFLSQPKEELC